MQFLDEFLDCLRCILNSLDMFFCEFDDLETERCEPRYCGRCTNALHDAHDAPSISDYEEYIEATSQGIKELSLKSMGMEKSLW